MYNSIIRKLDILNIVLAIVAMVALIVNQQAYLIALLLIISTISLVMTKHRFNKLFIFLTYTFTMTLFGILLVKVVDKIWLGSMLLPSNIIIILIMSLLIGGVAALAKFGTNTLSIVYFCLHILMIISAFQVNNLSILQSFWSFDAQIYTVQKLYPFLIAALLIGLFLEKYQMEIKRDRRNT